MVEARYYLNDGANWQAQAVLAYIRTIRFNGDGNEIYVGRYENCREQGYIFSLKNIMLNKQINIAVYEHRNSDQLCCVVFNTSLTLDTPSKELVWDAMGDSKYNYTKAFGYGHIEDCGSYIEEQFNRFIINNNKEQIL